MKRQFIFGNELWHHGICSGCSVENGTLSIQSRLEEQNTGQLLRKSVFLSYAFDSGEKEMVWNRFLMDFQLSLDVQFQISVFASDKTEVMINDTLVDLEVYLKEETRSLEEKHATLDSIWIGQWSNKKEVPLSMCKGRYLWFQLEFLYFKEIDMSIDFMKIEFPLESIASYLPSFYTSNHENTKFLTRFLGVYQSLVYDLQDDIESVSKNLDIDFVDLEYLKWLSEWVGSNLSFCWDEPAWKQFVKQSFRFYQKKGTLDCLKEVLTLFIGQPVTIIENFQIQSIEKNPERLLELQRVYSDDKYRFFVILHEEWLENKDKFYYINQLIELFQPVYAKAVLVPLKQSFVLGQHTYLEVNSRIAMNETLVLTDHDWRLGG